MARANGVPGDRSSSLGVEAICWLEWENQISRPYILLWNGETQNKESAPETQTWR